MTSLPSSRVPLQLETTPNTKPACSAAEIRGRTAFWLLIGRSGALCKSSFWENSIDRLLFRSIDFGQIFDRSNLKFDRSTFQSLRISSYLLMKFAIPLLLSLQKQKTQKLTKTLENSKAKGLTSANQGV
jgi:type I site-specific restriction endonuclease